MVTGDHEDIVRLTGLRAELRRDAILSRRTRIVRAGGLPEDCAGELKRKHPFHLALQIPGFQLHYRQGRWRRLEHGYKGEPPVRLRETHAWILRGRRKVGAMEFTEVDAELVFPFSLFDAMDRESGYLADVAEAVLSCWPDLPFQVTCYGPILLLDHVWFDRREGPTPALAASLDAMIALLLPRCALMVARPFPAEYGGRVPDDEAPSNVGFRRRLQAMVRLAERRFGFNRLPLPGDNDEVYLWRPRAGGQVPAPVYHFNWRDTLETRPANER
jgi:hypothetical protein